MIGRLTETLWTSAVASFLAASTLAAPLGAQEAHTCGAELRAGASVPVGEVNDVLDRSPLAGLAFGCRVGNRIWLHAGLDIAGIGSDIALYHLLAGSRWTLARSSADAWRATAGVHAGWTEIIHTGVSFGVPRRDGRLESSLTAGAEIRLLRRLSDHLGVFVDAGLRVLFVHSDDVVSAATGETIEGFDEVVLVPLSAGLDIGF